MSSSGLTGKEGVPRTGRTVLTDDELIVCDALFRAVTAENLLLSADFDESFNLPFDRHIPRENIPLILSRLRDVGAVEKTVSKGHGFWGLTAVGGAMWEDERAPNWNMFCNDSQRRIDGGDVLTIRAVRRDVADALFSAGKDAGLWIPLDSEIDVTVERNAEVTSWKRLDITIVAARVLRKAAPKNWELYESRRRWWRTISELLGTNGASGWRFVSAG